MSIRPRLGAGPGADRAGGAGQQPGRHEGDVGAGPARRLVGRRGLRRVVSPGRAASISPAQLATVSVLQFLLGLSDRDAAEAVRCRIDFKYALGLDLDDPGPADRPPVIDRTGLTPLGTLRLTRTLPPSSITATWERLRWTSIPT